MFAGVSNFARKWLVTAVSILFLAILGLTIFIAVLLNGSTIYKGIAIEGCAVSGMDRESAKEAVRQMINKKHPNNSIVIKYGEQTLKCGFEEISYGFLVNDAVDMAYAIGRTGKLSKRFMDIAEAAFKGKTVQVDESYDKDKVWDLLLKIKLSADKPAKNAQISYENGKVHVLEDSPGRSLDIDTNIKLLENQIMDRNFDNIILPLKEVTPDITFEKVNEINSVLSSFSTKFNKADVDRSYNIKLACSKLSGIILMPGEIFSMDETLGPRNTENGYRDAPVIFKNELVQGTGGGVCQVTTTLYNAVLKSYLKIVERSHHSMPLGYVQPGQDATIAEGSIDFKFRNSTDYPICISAGVVSDTVTIRILGRNNQDARIAKLVSETIEEIPFDENEYVADDTLSLDETVVEKEPRKGLRVALYRDTYDKDGELLKREKISEDYYKPVKGRIRVSSEYYNSISGISAG